ncbi:Flavin-dependent oxidoreductase, luciferase family (includes alkanesulfonate monooxygenase SsuD and methylene tetrahydromethanopterin reductase) [Mycobacterium rhizamassiliense]|jgi:F420-dependent oxidoreductase-like protein|uniref:Flavin-dependent oxidoreductase, luciferase family (Includes alkanesulfonate monooxygenase SsuD and methylene tetrahydromethanopterin reductase) n=1 Tax=Mycobacterium rhizamassiliense TaxID=1841860 RepID=A0A2U3NYI0_9MYCO|nr:LLM class flavin-dependent oxidoreductase [Mycobacterium rhizamassiliense]SPM36560.1 Flavin-dependent oxidoreductase, luciferase family (includes alkanesulfonate monooxygenase SsuD and methylene tetrahydromethanopterin reductase) [Mycobacterium rhizamassiliense]
MRISVKFDQCFNYSELEQLWRTADRLGFQALWDYDHFLGPKEHTDPTYEGWTTLAAMAAVTQRARIGCLVSGVTHRNPAILAKMAVTVDHISGGRLNFGIGAGWHEAEHRGYGIDFPDPGARVAMVDEALTVIRRLWTEESVTFSGRFFTLERALCEPKPLQRPHPPIVVGGTKPEMLRVIARHADIWNMSGHEGPEGWGAVNARLDQVCADMARPPAEVLRSAQLPLHPVEPDQVDEQLALLPAFEQLGCAHMVLAFRQPPTAALLERCRALDSDVRPIAGV